jgi:hypothetical protein
MYPSELPAPSTPVVQDARAPPVKVVTERPLSNAIDRALDGFVDLDEGH